MTKEDRDRKAQTKARDERAKETGRPQTEADAVGRSEEGRAGAGQRAEGQERETQDHYKEAVEFVRDYFTTEDWPVTDGMADAVLRGALRLLFGVHPSE